MRPVHKDVKGYSECGLFLDVTKRKTLIDLHVTCITCKRIVFSQKTKTVNEFNMILDKIPPNLFKSK